MVNNVTGFIGPETHLDNFEMIVANLQDHFMGKLLGLPMGMAPCYTLHSQITLEGQQMATQLLASAGANYYMDVYLNTDRMLAYFDTSGHDNQTLREVHGRTHDAGVPGIGRSSAASSARTARATCARGPNWGRPEIFCQTADRVGRAVPRDAGPVRFRQRRAAAGRRSQPPAAAGAGRRPARRPTASWMSNELQRIGRFRVCQTEAADKASHLNNPRLGSRLSEESLQLLRAEANDVQIVVSDGLSAEAVHANLPDLLPVLLDGLASRDAVAGRADRWCATAASSWPSTSPKCCRPPDRAADRRAARRRCLSSRSLSAYLVYQLLDPGAQAEAARFSGHPEIRFEYTVISNIYSGGLPPVEAGSLIVESVCADPRCIRPPATDWRPC